MLELIGLGFVCYGVYVLCKKADKKGKRFF
ncbi:hypothetical protein PJKIFABJ_00029 [Pseudomonas phage PE09]|uniref:Uncharacterized protein n=2 Tax=Otagovirus TaxID=2560197 RepID=A0A7S7YCI2_9CAUD|nr:hypothetical protein QGX22_gp029 [Pseudomonas phage PE09]YP_010768334.1 hypothetical protein QGX23_gp026 [Pseudomonas phage PN09]QHZ59984.1 hypothetical protein PJKIFABJ_00029 [Pseudomonas phage PE09]QPB10447.1 hypothetical protein PN09_026 [Pseudomonas phage PN09]